MGQEGKVKRHEELQLRPINKNCYALGLKNLVVFKGVEVCIVLIFEAQIFCKPYGFSKAENEMINARTKELIRALIRALIEFLDREYASVILMSSNKDVYDN